MKDFWHKITGWMDKNRYTFLSFAIVVVLALSSMSGCLESKVASIINQGREVTRIELVVEAALLSDRMDLEQVEIKALTEAFNLRLEQYNERLGVSLSALDAKDLKTEKLLNTIGGFATVVATGGATIPGVIGSLLTLAGIGYGISNKLDNTRKDAVIRKLKTTT